MTGSASSWPDTGQSRRRRYHRRPQLADGVEAIVHFFPIAPVGPSRSTVPVELLRPPEPRTRQTEADHEEGVAARGACSPSRRGRDLTQTTDELVNDGKNTDNVTTQSMGYDRKSYSPLKQINTSNVKRLVPVWSASLMNDLGELAAPTIYNGVMYVINGKWTFAHRRRDGPADLAHAGRARTGRRSGAAITRGAATIYNGKLFRVTIDNHLLALDMKTGKQVWNQKFADGEGGLLRHRRAHRRQRRADFRHGRRRVDDARVPRRLGSGDRQEAVAPLHDSGAGRAGIGDVAEGQRRLEVRRRADVALGFLRSRSSISSTGASATPSRTIRGRAARSTACTRRACSPSGRRPARSSATSSTRRTTSTTSTAPTSRCSPTSGSTASRAR